MSSLFAVPGVVDPQLSPDGRWLAWRVPAAAAELRLRSLDGGEEDVVLPAAGEAGEVAAYAWHAGGGSLGVLRRRDDGWHVELVDLDGVGGSAATREIVAISDGEVSLVALPEGSPTRVLVGVRRPTADENRLLAIDPESGGVAEAGRGGGDVARWWVDAAGVPRAAEHHGLDGSWRLTAVIDGRPAEALLACTADETCRATSLDPAGRRLTLVTDRGVATQLAPAILDLATGALEALAAVAAVPSAAATAAAALEGPGATPRRIGDAVVGTGAEVEVVSSSADGRIELVADAAGALLLVDHREGVVHELMRLRPPVEVARRPQRRSLRYVARDGLSIPAELTLPAPAATAAASPGGLPAAVLLPPDDPSRAPRVGRQPLVELFADRGYVVLQPSPRGSAGFGPAFRAAGDRQWGGAMLDDIADGVRWLVSQGLADPERVAIVGFGWGGYAAVAALAFTPDLYAAGVAIDGPLDLEALVRRSEDPWRAAVLRRRVGDPDHFEQGQRLRRHSPLAHAGAIRAPLLRIDLEEGAWSDPEGSARLIAVLRQLRRPVEVLAVGGSGGRLEGTAGALVAAEIERFLALHLDAPGGRPLLAERPPGDVSRDAATTPAAEPVAAGAGP